MKLLDLVWLFLSANCLRLRMVSKGTEASKDNAAITKTTERTQEKTRYKMDILMRGWIKIVRTHSDQSGQLEGMEVNSEFGKGENNGTERDEWGSIDIPSNEHFFMLVTGKDLYILKGRRNDMIRTYKSMAVDTLLPLRFVNDTFSGGLEDLGSFSEGYCFKVENTL